MGILGAVLALTGGLDAACFVKAFGITFLAMPRSKEAEKAKESPFLMVASMIFLSAAAILFGIMALPILKKLIYISGTVFSINAGSPSFNFNNLITIPGLVNSTALSVPAITLLLIGSAGLAFIFVILFFLFFFSGGG